MTENYMVPLGSFDPEFENLDQQEVERYSEFLRKVEEPSLWEASSNAIVHAYRLLLRLEIRSAGPLLIRLNIESSGEAIASVKIWERVCVDDSLAQERLVSNFTKRVTQANVDRFLGQLEKVHYWTLPSSDGVLGADGETWNIEGAKLGQFHIVTRWSPSKDFLELGYILADICELPRWKDIISKL